MASDKIAEVRVLKLLSQIAFLDHGLAWGVTKASRAFVWTCDRLRMRYRPPICAQSPDPRTAAAPSNGAPTSEGKPGGLSSVNAPLTHVRTQIPDVS